MGKKYIIEIGRLERLYKAFINGNGKPEITWLSPEVDLIPYTDPDMEKVREEAYEDGYKTAKVQCNIQAEKDLREVGERHYQKGLSDAWECARKIALTEGLGIDGMYAVFGEEDPEPIFRECSANECIESVRRYEQEKDKQARIKYNSDEIKDVLNTTMKECNVSLDDIAEVLQKMREGQEQ